MEDKISADGMIPALILRHNRYQREHFCDGSAGHAYAGFGLVLSGSTHLTGDRLALDLPAGSFFFLPQGTRYRSRWCGEPEIEYVMLHFTPPERLPAFLPTRLAVLSTDETRRTVLEIERRLQGTVRDQALAVASFYTLFASALPHLQAGGNDGASPTLQRATSYIREHLNESFSVPFLAAQCCVGASTLYHVFKKDLGVSPVEYRNELRLLLAAKMLRQARVSTEEILTATGFSSPVYFREQFKRYYGMTPTEYRRTVMDR